MSSSNSPSPLFATTVCFQEQVEVPLSLRSLAAFRCWVQSPEFPDRGRIDYLSGRIEVDMSPEDLFFHSAVKTEMARVLSQLVKTTGSGHLFIDGMRVSCPAEELSVEPDIVLLCETSLADGTVHLVPKAGGQPDRYIEIEGPPDLIVEIVSDSSVRKDTERLPPAYFAAGVKEFWLIDARGTEPLFIIHSRGSDAFLAAAADPDGYRASTLLQRSYRLDRSRNTHGRLVFDLQERA